MVSGSLKVHVNHSAVIEMLEQAKASLSNQNEIISDELETLSYRAEKYSNEEAENNRKIKEIEDAISNLKNENK